MRVTVEDLADGLQESYTLVAPPESDPFAGRLSSESPVGRALEGRRAGEAVDVLAPQGTRHLRIVAVGA